MSLERREPARKNILKEQYNTKDSKEHDDVLDYQKHQEKISETQREIERFTEKIKTILGQISIKLINLWNNKSLADEINKWNEENKNQKDMYIVTWNLIWICRKYMNDPSHTSILDQLQFCMNSLRNQYNVKGEIDWITESIKAIWDAVKMVYRPEEDGWNIKKEISFSWRSFFPKQYD